MPGIVGYLSLVAHALSGVPITEMSVHKSAVYGGPLYKVLHTGNSPLPHRRVKIKAFIE